VTATDEWAMRTISRRLPARYQILPASIDFRIPGFEQYCVPGNKTLALRQRECAAWFNEFVDVVVESCGRRFLPICRLSDGEFLFLLGPQPPVSWQPPLRRWGGHVLTLWRRCQARRGFSAYTQGHYHSGSYSRTEWDRERPEYSNMLQKLSRNGILALHLSYSEKPFQERYFPAFAKWLDENLIELNDHNYYPFYFVYAMLSGQRRRDVLAGRRILVVNGTPEPKRSRIIDGLVREGVEDVTWLGISSDRSLYDRIDLSVASRRLDLVLVGAGIGKPNILLQLEPLGIPCIDAGYMFEVWADSENGRERPFCEPSPRTRSPYLGRAAIGT